MQVQPEKTHYDLRIGVTGHRNLDHAEPIAAAVERLLDHLAQTFDAASEFPHGDCGSSQTMLQRCDSRLARLARPALAAFGVTLPIAPDHTPQDRRTPIAWNVISPLAKGADRIVASAVLRRASSRLEVISPLPLDEYRKDFAEPEDLAEFEELLASDPRPTELNSKFDPDADNRSEAYFSVGRRVVETSEILIAVWDGKAGKGGGGTAAVVQHAVEQRRMLLWIHADNPDEPVRMIVGEPSDHTEAGPLPDMWLLPLPQTAKALSLGFHRLAAYHRDAGFDEAECQSSVDREAEKLRQMARDSGLPESALEPVLKELLPHYERANQLAILYQNLYVFAAKWLFRLSSLAVTIVVFHILFFPHAVWLVSFEIAAMLAAVVLLRISTHEAWHEKWLNDRHLAEWLRTTMFTILLDREGDPLSEMADVLPFYRGPDNWFISAHQSTIDRVGESTSSNLSLKALKGYLIDGWIQQQADWHRCNAKKKYRAAHWYHHTGIVLFTLTLVMAVLHLIGVGHVESTVDSDHAANGLIGQSITFLAIVLPAWGATVHAVGNLLEHKRLATRSLRMAEILRGIAIKAEETESIEAFRNEVARAEKIMAAENHEWLVSLSFRGLVLPA